MQSMKLPTVSNYLYPIKKMPLNTYSCKSDSSSYFKKKKFKILIVEDGIFNQKIAKLLLESVGYEVDIVENGQQVLSVYEDNYDAILMDIDLPDMNGKDICKIIREKERCTNQHIPIIAVTANHKSMQAECLAAGMDEFTQKPINITLLKRILTKYFKNAD